MFLPSIHAGARLLRCQTIKSSAFANCSSRPPPRILKRCLWPFATSALPPRKRTGNERPSMSAKCQKQPSTVRGGIPGMPAYGNWHTRGEILPLHWSVDGKLVLQILFDRGISDRHEDQCSLKARDELVVFDRIDGCSRCSAPACLLGAITSGRVPTLGGAMIDYLTCLGWNLLGPSRLIRAGCPLMIKR